MRDTTLSGAAVLAGALSLQAACGGATAQTSGAALGAGAAGNVVVGAAMWALGKGCNMQGCPYGSYCNHESGFCDTRRCQDGCPESTACNEGLNRCQDPPPPSVPNDFLPSDSQRLPLE